MRHRSKDHACGRTLLKLFAAGLCGALAACGGGGGGGSTTSAPPTISGTTTQGPTSGATVVVSEASTDTVLGTGTTDAQGRFSVALSRQPVGAVQIDVTGGSYVSEFSGSSVSCAGVTLSAVLASAPGDVANVSVTPLSDLMTWRAQELADTLTNSAAIAQAGNETKAMWGLGNSAEKVLPDFNTVTPSSNADGNTMAMALVALDTFAHQVSPSAPCSVSQKLGQDFTDGQLDGMDANGATVTYGGGTLDADALKAQLFVSTQTAVNAVANGVSPKSLLQWQNANPDLASTADLAPKAPKMSCPTGYTLANDSAGRATCWDGTRDSNSDAPLVGSYTQCELGGVVANASSCPQNPPTCATGYTLIQSGGENYCWDGTTSGGTPYLGSYYQCGDGQYVTNESSCTDSGLHPVYNSTSIVIVPAPTYNTSASSTTSPTYQQASVTEAKAAAVSSVVDIPAATKSVITAATTASLPSYVSSPSGGLNQAQIDWYAVINQSIVNFYSY